MNLISFHPKNPFKLFSNCVKTKKVKTILTPHWLMGGVM